MILKRILIIALLLGAALSAAAQDHDSVMASLAAGPGGRITVREHGDVASTLARLRAGNPAAPQINVYKIVIFMSNSQNAREQAVAAMNRFKELFAGVPVEMVYDKIYFKVKAGNCLTSDEAITLWGRIKGVFDRAIVTQERVGVSNFIAAEEKASAEVEAAATAE